MSSRLFDLSYTLLELPQSGGDAVWVLVDPAIGNLFQWNRVEVVTFLPTAPKMDHQICLVE